MLSELRGLIANVEADTIDDLLDALHDWRDTTIQLESCKSNKHPEVDAKLSGILLFTLTLQIELQALELDVSRGRTSRFMPRLALITSDLDKIEEGLNGLRVLPLEKNIADLVKHLLE